MGEEEKSVNTSEVKALRLDIAECTRTAADLLKRTPDGPQSEHSIGEYRRAVALSRTKLQEAKMWLGKALEAMGSELPEEYRDEPKDDKAAE